MKIIVGQTVHFYDVYIPVYPVDLGKERNMVRRNFELVELAVEGSVRKVHDSGLCLSFR